jgi:cobalt-zinc-cadmium efflux system outer membrane protein
LAPGALSENKADLSLADALALALAHNPELATFSYEMRIQEANALQASLLPNPEFDAEIENFAGSGSLNGFDESELTLSIGQLIELGGKRQVSLVFGQCTWRQIRLRL